MIFNQLRMWYNKVRIIFLRIFTDRIKKIEITDNKGKKHIVTTEHKMEKVCQHDLLRQISFNVWVCDKCKDVYFDISYKLIITESQLITHMENIAGHLKKNFDDMVDNQDKNDSK